jgi:outer membrane receptor protein involved in Fe transport
MLQYPDNAFEPNAGFVTSDTAAQRLSQWWNTSISPYQVFERDFVSDLFETGYTSAYSGSVSGGTSSISYFASGRYQYEDGPIGAESVARGKDKATRAQATASLSMVPHQDLRLSLRTMYTEARSDIPGSNNNNIYAPITLAIFGQPQRASCVTNFGRSDPTPGTGECTGVGNPRGQAAFATVGEAFQRTIEQDTRHFNASLQGRYSATASVALDATFGVDIVRQDDEFFQPFGHNIDLFTTNAVEGTRTVSDRNYREVSLDTKLSWSTDLTSSINSQLVGGVQGFIRRLEITGGSGTAFPGPGFEVAEAGGIQDVDETFLSTVSAGFFAQEQIGWHNWIFGTVGARYDYSSAFGEAAGGVLYPKVSLSIIPSDRPAWTNTLLSTLRFRGAIGQSGQQPGAFDKLTTYSAIRSDALGAGIAPDNLGNPDLKPEISTEWETGAELGLFSDRIALEFTYWDRTVRDALIQRQFPVTGGFLDRQLSNIGRLDAHGIELGLRGNVYTGRTVQINAFASGAFLREEITSLGGAPPLKVGGAYPRYRNWLREGFAPGAFFGPVLRRGTEYPLDINGDCQPDTRADLLTYFGTPRTEASFAILLEGGDPRPCSLEKGHLLNYLGKPNPDWQGSFGADAVILGRLRVATMFEFKAGDFWVHNLTDAFRRAHPSLGGNLRGSAEAKATLRDPASSAEERLAAALDWAHRWAALTPYDGLHEVERADFVRWRELSFAYDVPERLIAGVGGANSMTLTLTARNLALWTKYSGADPEINLHGRTAGLTPDFLTESQTFATSLDAFGLPLARRYSFAIRMGF